jgi:isopentenyl-diphosphate Delta-isomerase
MDEIIDIVDDKDNVIGNEFRLKCHADKILHRGVTILIFEDESFSKVLIQKRSMKKISNPGKLCPPGGHLSSGDEYIEGAKRELQEEEFYNQELPQQITLEKLYNMKIFTVDDYEFHEVYRVIYPGPFSHNPEEVEDSYFVEINQLIEDIEKNPQNYTCMTALNIREYNKRYLSKLL